jgi:hypothetical protein
MVARRLTAWHQLQAIMLPPAPTYVPLSAIGGRPSLKPWEAGPASLARRAAAEVNVRAIRTVLSRAVPAPQRIGVLRVVGAGVLRRVVMARGYTRAAARPRGARK